MTEKAQKPALRFEGFTDAWEQRKLSYYLEVSLEKNVQNAFTRLDVLSVSGDYGIVNQIEFQGRSFAGANVSNYGIVQTGDVVYTKSPLNSNPFGIIKVNRGKAGIVSTLYAVYCPKKNVYPPFIQNYFEQHARVNNYLHPLVNKGAKNDMKVSSENALKGDICFPNLDEQHQISSFLDHLDHLITLHQRKSETLKNVKKSMLEKMFPQGNSKIPAVRFAGFTDAWEQRKLYQLAEIVGGGTPSSLNPEYWDGDIDWYAPAEIGEQIYVEKSVRQITELGLQKSSAKILPAFRTVLFTSRAGIGNMAILRKDAATNQGFQSLVCKADFDPYFAFSLGADIKKKAETVAAGSTFLEISGKALGNIEVNVPSSNEQNAIAKFFECLDHLITLHQRKLEMLKNLKKACLEKMFV